MQASIEYYGNKAVNDTLALSTEIVSRTEVVSDKIRDLKSKLSDRWPFLDLEQRRGAYIQNRKVSIPSPFVGAY